MIDRVVVEELQNRLGDFADFMGYVIGYLDRSSA